jgi:butyrate kinase
MESQFDSNGVEQLQSVVDLVEIAGSMQSSTVAIAGGHRVEDLRLVESARDHGIIDRIILIGKERLVTDAVHEVGIEISDDDIVAAEDDESIATATVQLIRAGDVDVVLKGGISTPVINRHIIRLAVRPTVSLATIVEAAPVSDGRPIIITDAGVTTVCNFGRVVNLIENAVEVAHSVMGIEMPRVAVLSANEKQIPSLPSTWMGRRLAERTWPDALVCGPLSFDLATDPESVTIKGVPDLPHAEEVAGRADVLVCPGIDSANILYKVFTAMSKFGQASMAGITVGFPVPYIILSRADTLETRLLSIALCSIYAHRVHGKSAAGDRKKESGEGISVSTGAASARPRILVINPGSTSLKLALFENSRALHEIEISHTVPSLSSPTVVKEQVDALTNTVLQTCSGWGEPVFDAIAARGGFVPRPPCKLTGGTYIFAEVENGAVNIDGDLVNAMVQRPESDHPSNLGIPVAAGLAERFKVPAYTVDPVVVDEFIPVAEISGYADITRLSASHALSIHAAASRASLSIGRPVEDVNLVVAHLGGGITVAAVRGGRMIDNNIALLGEGPFSPRRAGSLPLGGIIDLCYSGRFTREELAEELTERGGLFSYLGDYRMDAIEEMISSGDEKKECAQLVLDAMVYRIAKEIGAMYMAAECDIEAVVLTGGLTRSSLIVGSLRKRVVRLAPVFVFQGSLEMEALARGAADSLTGAVQPLRFSK